MALRIFQPDEVHNLTFGSGSAVPFYGAEMVAAVDGRGDVAEMRPVSLLRLQGRRDAQIRVRVEVVQRQVVFAEHASVTVDVE